MITNLVSVLALITAVTSQREIYRVCVKTHDKTLCTALARRDSRLVCSEVSNKLDCAFRLARNEADIGIFSDEEMLLLSQMQPDSHRVVASIRNVENMEQFAFETVAVVSISHTNGLQGLQQGGYCHPGLDQTEHRWSPRVSKILERAVAGTDRCAERETHGKTFEELETATLSGFFKAACRPGRWSLNDSLDARLKREYPNLCTLCSGNGTSDCTGYRYKINGISEASSTNRHMQALECLTKYSGTVAYVAWQHVTEYFLGYWPKMIPDYALLCPNGTLVRLTYDVLYSRVLPCAWIQQPWSAVVTRSEQAAAVLSDMKTWWPYGGEYNRYDYSTWQGIFFNSFIGGENRLLFYEEDQMPNALEYVSTGRNLTPIEAAVSCMPVQRWCTVSDDERAKCNWVRNALYTLGIEPPLSCLQRQSHLQCLSDIKDNRADFIAIDSNYGYLGRHKYNLSPVKTILNHREFLSRVAALVRSNSDIVRFEDLKGKKACFPEYGGVAFASFVATAHNKSILNTSECNYAKAVAEFFNGTCAPGALDDMHKLYDGNFNTQSLCDVCALSVISEEPWGTPTCATDSNNAYYGNNGALACLVYGAADVVFVEVQNLQEYFEHRNWIPADTFKVLCSANDSLGWPGAPITDDCLMSLVIGGEVLARRNDPQLMSLESLLTHLDLNFGYGVSTTIRNLLELEIYSSFDGNSDLLFKNSVVGLTSNPVFRPARDYNQLIEHLENCPAGSKNLATERSAFSTWSLLFVSGLLSKLYSYHFCPAV